MTCYPASLPRLQSVWLHTQKAGRPERLWVCDVKCGQGVPGLALTTEQGSVFVQGSYLAFLVYWHTVCSTASLSHRRAANMGITCGKANSTELFFWILVEPSCLKVFFFSAFKCCTQSSWQTHHTWHGPFIIAIHTMHQAVCPLCIFVVLLAGWYIIYSIYLRLSWKYSLLLLTTTTRYSHLFWSICRGIIWTNNTLNCMFIHLQHRGITKIHVMSTVCRLIDCHSLF